MPVLTLPAKAATGDTWTNQTAADSAATGGNILVSVCYDGSTYVAVGQNGTIIISSNGATWTSEYQVPLVLYTLKLSGHSYIMHHVFICLQGAKRDRLQGYMSAREASYKWVISSGSFVSIAKPDASPALPALGVRGLSLPSEKPTAPRKECTVKR